MKKILLLSDTHSYVDTAILNHAKLVDEVWHAGDIGDLKVTDQLKAITTVRGVYGNIDNALVRQEFPLDLKFTLEGVHVWITHIGGYPKKYNIRIREEIQAKPPKLFITGHSHILKVMPDKDLNLLHMNPGAIGKHGFHKKRTMLRFELNQGQIQNLEVIEYSK